MRNTPRGKTGRRPPPACRVCTLRPGHFELLRLVPLSARIRRRVEALNKSTVCDAKTAQPRSWAGGNPNAGKRLRQTWREPAALGEDLRPSSGIRAKNFRESASLISLQIILTTSFTSFVNRKYTHPERKTRCESHSHDFSRRGAATAE